MSAVSSRFTSQVGIRLPVIGGAMYPCSNPELVAAVSAAGGIGVVQPVSMTYVFGHDFREGLRLIKSTTNCPIGMNALIEKSSQRYHERLVKWVEIALEEGVRFFVTSLGNPAWVVSLRAPNPKGCPLVAVGAASPSEPTHGKPPRRSTAKR